MHARMFAKIIIQNSQANSQRSLITQRNRVELGKQHKIQFLDISRSSQRAPNSSKLRQLVQHTPYFDPIK